MKIKSTMLLAGHIKPLQRNEIRNTRCIIMLKQRKKSMWLEKQISQEFVPIVSILTVFM
jgi:hypothetical protein